MRHSMQRSFLRCSCKQEAEFVLAGKMTGVTLDRNPQSRYFGDFSRQEKVRFVAHSREQNLAVSTFLSNLSAWHKMQRHAYDHHDRNLPEASAAQAQRGLLEPVRAGQRCLKALTAFLVQFASREALASDVIPCMSPSSTFNCNNEYLDDACNTSVMQLHIHQSSDTEGEQRYLLHQRLCRMHVETMYATHK